MEALLTVSPVESEEILEMHNVSGDQTYFYMHTKLVVTAQHQKLSVSIANIRNQRLRWILTMNRSKI